MCWIAALIAYLCVGLYFTIAALVIGGLPAKGKWDKWHIVIGKLALCFFVWPYVLIVVMKEA